MNYQVTISDIALRKLVQAGKALNIRDGQEVMEKAIDSLIDRINGAKQEQQNTLFIDQAEACMLHPQKFPWANVILGPPAGKEDEVYSVFGGIGEWGDTPMVATCWGITDEQLEQLKESKQIWICNMGTTILPTCVSPVSPARLPWVTITI